MSHDPRLKPDPMAERGILVEAENGPAIEYDETGIILHLADRVIADIGQRLGGQGWAAEVATTAAKASDGAANPRAAGPGEIAPQTDGAGTDKGSASLSLSRRAETRLDPALLGDIDAWDLTDEGDFYTFSARLPGLASEARRYRQEKGGGAILAETGGPLRAILGLGGGRHATTFASVPDFPQHVVGVALPDEGERPVLANALRHASGESLLADRLLYVRYQAHRALPLMPVHHVLAPPGLDPSPLLPELFASFDRIRSLAKTLDRPARLEALRLDLGFDQAPLDPLAFYAFAQKLLDQIAAGMAALGAGDFPILLCPDAGPWWQAKDQLSRSVHAGLHQLLLRPGAHRLIVPAPGYAFEQDDLGQPTLAAMEDRAELEAMALAALAEGQDWLCPMLVLAERDGAVLRASFRAMGNLVLDRADPFGAGPGAGFALRGTGAQIRSVSIAPDDPQAMLLHLDGAPLPDASVQSLSLELGFGSAALLAERRAHPPASTALREDWAAKGRGGKALYRWALPAVVQVH